MILSEKLKRYALECYEKRLPLLGETREAWEACCEEESKSSGHRLLLKLLVGTLPLPDLGDSSPALLDAFVSHGLAVREGFPWCAQLPEHLFILHVLSPRINTEALANCRPLFRSQLEERVRGLSLPEAILEVNRWCAEHVTYRSTDLRTASPLEVYRCGFGRCGEESTFTVTALRSVGIAARQVYAPWWSHCDDNHAWVEAFDGEGWRYLGACEPEPVLDMGWFTSASSRAMLLHTRSFCQGTQKEWGFLFPDARPHSLIYREGMVVENIISRYGETQLLQVQVVESGKPVPGAALTFSVCNQACFLEIAQGKTDQNGEFTLELGLGAVHISALWEDRWGELLVDTAGCAQPVVTLSQLPKAGKERDLSFRAPVDRPPQPGSGLTQAQKEERKRCLETVTQLRTVIFSTCTPIPPSSKVRGSFSQKDIAHGIPQEVLEDWEAATARWQPQSGEEELFSRYLLAQRIGWEQLTSYRRELEARFTSEERAFFVQNPREIWHWVTQNILSSPNTYSALWGTPKGMLALGQASPLGKGLLFVAICRSLGIPARLSPADGKPQYERQGVFHSVEQELPLGSLTLIAPQDAPGLFRQNYTLSRWERRSWQKVEAGDIPQGESRRLEVEPGLYQVFTVSRMPNGNQLARETRILVKPGEAASHALFFRQGKIQDMVEACLLPAFQLTPILPLNRDGEKIGSPQSSTTILGEGFHLLVWLEVSREPTEHILNELREHARAFAQAPVSLHFIVESEEDLRDATLQKTLSQLERVFCWTGEYEYNVTTLARRMYVDPERLPLILLTKGTTGIYATCGYNVGTAQLLLRMIEVD